MLLVLDTNVLVSALLKQESVPGLTIQIILRDHFLAVDTRMLTEYRLVTARPQFRINPYTREKILSSIASFSMHVQATPLDVPPVKLLDPKDLPFAEVAVAAKADALVTGNVRHFAFLSDFGIKTLTPAQFVKMFE